MGVGLGDLENTGFADGFDSPEERKRTMYAAFASGDARFDVQTLVGASSTGARCRATCAARMPKRENCASFHAAAEAETASCRPCPACRPEAAPGTSGVDARPSPARRAPSELCQDFGHKMPLLL